MTLSSNQHHVGWSGLTQYSGNRDVAQQLGIERLGKGVHRGESCNHRIEYGLRILATGVIAGERQHITARVGGTRHLRTLAGITVTATA